MIISVTGTTNWILPPKELLVNWYFYLISGCLNEALRDRRPRTALTGNHLIPLTGKILPLFRARKNRKRNPRHRAREFLYTFRRFARYYLRTQYSLTLRPLVSYT